MIEVLAVVIVVLVVPWAVFGFMLYVVWAANNMGLDLR